MKVIFNEFEAQTVLAEVNQKVARAFLTEPKTVRFVFRNHIPLPPGKRGVCLGLCIHGDEGGDNEIQIKVAPGWQNTAIHELAHFYDPDCPEKRIDKVAKDIIRYLKGSASC